MSPGLIAFFAIIAILLASYAIFAPENNNFTTNIDGETVPLTNPNGLFEKWVRPAIHNFLPHSPDSLTEYAHNSEGIQGLLARSGNPWRITAEEYIVFRVLAGGVGALFLLFLTTTHYISIPHIASLFLGLVVGQLIPKILLDSKWSKRKREVTRTLPEALDLLRICMNAGQNFSNALIQTVALIPPGVTQEELRRVVAEVSAGRRLTTALRAFSTRCPTEGVEAFVRAIEQSEASGSDIATTLSYQSDETRASYERAVEVRAQKLQTTLFLPIIAFLLPVLMILIFGPAMSSIGGAF